MLLFTAAVFLAISTYFASTVASTIISARSAELIATFAYFALVIGVLFQLGNVNSQNARKVIAPIKKNKVALQLVHLVKNRLKKEAVFHGSG